MTITQLISTNIPQLTLQDKVSKALTMMDDFELNHLCVIQKDKFIGIVGKEDLLNRANDNLTVDSLQEEYLHSLILEQEHFSKALQIISEKNLTLLPVLNAERDFIGVITSVNLLHQLSFFLGGDVPGGIIIIEMENRNFSFSEISRLIETHDSLITQLNTQLNKETGLLQITLKLNKTEIADIIATLQRFEYHIVAYYGEEAYTNELQDNYSHLMHYLNI
jgi:acetoin utilization protein AcuB